MATGLYWWMRRPASRFGPLLVAFGLLVWVVSWQGADPPLAFDLAVLAEAPYFLLTFYLFLAFPMGRLEPRAACWLMAALGLGVVAFFLPWARISPVIAGGGPLTRCAPSCPANVLQVGAAPNVVEGAGKAETYTALTIAAAVFLLYLWRLRTASRPQRRALVAVAVTSLLFLPAYFVYNFAAWILMLDPATARGRLPRRSPRTRRAIGERCSRAGHRRHGRPNHAWVACRFLLRSLDALVEAQTTTKRRQQCESWS